jgi:ABC-type multidrug transport system permease subunit
VFSIFGGSIVQVDQLSGAFRLISYITPNRWFIKGVELISTGTFPTLHFTVLLLTGILLFLLAAVFLKRRITI